MRTTIITRTAVLATAAPASPAGAARTDSLASGGHCIGSLVQLRWRGAGRGVRYVIERNRGNRGPQAAGRTTRARFAEPRRRGVRGYRVAACTGQRCSDFVTVRVR